MTRLSLHRPIIWSALVSLFLATLGTHSVLAGPVIVPGWGSPVFQDEFTGNSIDTSAWELGNWPGNHNNELQYYHPNQVSVWNDALHLRADIDPSYSNGRLYNSGLVRTWQEWSYGRFEARAKLPYGQGFWPAVWLLPRHAPWPAGGEIDIMEARGDLPYRVSSALHWGWDTNSHQYRSEWHESGANFQQGYHDYTVEWEVGTVRFYVDGVQHMTLYEPDVGIPGTPKSLILNLAVGGDYSGFPDGSTPFPSGFDIDYVRVWQRPEPVAPPVSMISDPGFEENGGALADWDVFGDTIGNVLSDYGTPLDGERSLKLYGQFIGEDNASGAYQSVAVNGGTRLVAGAQTLTRSEDSIVGTGNRAEMKLEFYSQTGAAYDSEFFLGESIVTIADTNSPEDAWSYFQIDEVTPLEAVEARVTFAFVQPHTNDSGSVFIDSVTLYESLGGDFDGDSDVDAVDLLKWQRGESANPWSQTELAAWQANYGTSATQSAATTVPEPASFSLALAVLGLSLCRRRR